MCKYQSFQQHILRKFLTTLLFNNFCTSLKSDIFSTCVFNNFCRHTSKIQSPFFFAFTRTRSPNLFNFNSLAIQSDQDECANPLIYHQHTLRITFSRFLEPISSLLIPTQIAPLKLPSPPPKSFLSRDHFGLRTGSPAPALPCAISRPRPIPLNRLS